MTVDELIEALSAMPGYRPVQIPGGTVTLVEDYGTYVELIAMGLVR
jgi:hypothetical protein